MLKQLILPALFYVAALPLSAGPGFLDRTSFKAAVNGTVTLVDNLDGVPLVPSTSNSILLANGVFSVPAPSLAQVSTWANMAKVVGETSPQGQVARTATFANFTPGTTFFGAEVAIPDSDSFRITAVGNSGTTVVQMKGQTLNGFAGFSDPTGIISVTFQNLGTLTTPNRFAPVYFGQFSTSRSEPGPVISIPPFVSQGAKANCSGATKGSVQAKSTDTTVTLQVTFDVPGASAQLWANNTRVATLFPGQRAPYQTTTVAALLDRIPDSYKLTFDPYGNFYSIRSADGSVTYLTCSLGGQPAGGDLARVP